MAYEHRLIVQPALIAVLLLSTTAEAGSVVYVDDDAAAAGDGSTWNTAYRFLQDAITAASNPGNSIAEIRVAQGLYLPDRDEANPAGTGDRMATFELINGVVLAGGYAGQGAPDPDARDASLFETVLDGDLSADDDLLGPNACCQPNATPGCDDAACETTVCELAPSCCDTAWDPLCAGIASSTCTLNCPVLQDNSLHVVTGTALTDATAVLDGFTIVAGYADVAPDDGGGLICLGGSPTVVACLFERNIALGDAGAFAWGDGSPSINDCSFVGNIAGSGGAIANDGAPVITGSIFTGNGAFVSGAVKNLGALTMVDCMLSGNSAYRGGVIFTATGELTFVGCTFMDNFASEDGGAIQGFTLELTIDRCSFIGNVALDGNGGAITTTGLPVIVNSVFNGNFAAGDGGAIHLDTLNSSGTQIANCTVTNNIAGGDGGGFYISDDPLRLDNSIVWGNSDGGLSVEAAQIHLDGGNVVALSNSCIQGLTGALGGSGNIGDDPMFVDLDGSDDIPGNADDDLSLAAGTPCVNLGIGNLAVNLGTVDIAGNARVQACRIDAGAFESPYFLADCNANGQADECDLVNGVSPDCNGNGILDSCDIAAQTSIDCNGNGLPDECDVTPDLYRVDDGSQELNILATGGNLIWFNEFRAIADNEVIHAVDICWGNVDEGHPADIAVWIDPDDDGDPINALLVMLLVNVPIENPQTGTFVTIPIPPTFVGHTGEVFYVGAHVAKGPGDAPACVDQTAPLRRRSWAAVGDNLVVLADNVLPPAILDDDCPECAGNWMIRARRAGASDDMDGNGWPDECAFADLDGDGIVGITDFLWLLGAWGPCDDCDQCPADLDNDCAVGINDFLILLGNWTP